MTEMNVKADEKSVLREQMKAMRREKNACWITAHGEEAQRRAMDLEEIVNSEKIGCYVATPKEVGTNVVIGACRDMGKRIFLPAYDAQTHAYRFVEAERRTDLVAGPLGILEPSGGTTRDASELDVVFVPGLAFDEKGNRLGHGAGHYDALLSDSAAVFKVGLAFEFQMVRSVVAHERDIAMNAVITNARVIRVMN